MTLRTIYLDMDGVLCDLVTPVMKLHGRDDLLRRGAWPKGEYSMEKLLNITTPELWAPVIAQGAAFWSDLDPYPWAYTLYSYAIGCCPDVAVLTKPTECPFSHSGKFAWIRRMSKPEPLSYVLTPEKWRCAGPGCLLIDDCEENIREWRNKGGIGILFPQRWNNGRGSYKDVIAELIRLAG